jgi:tRNA (guanine-N7-)-methyltransferase
MAKTLRDYPRVSLETDTVAGELNFALVFGRVAPVHVEIGCGKGTFLVNEARTQPQVDFLAIEWARKYYRWVVDRIGRWDLTNVRIVRAEAAQFLKDVVPSQSVDCCHVYFPDPWPKRRHYKRRFFRPDNLEQLVRCLKVGGLVKIATDHARYYELIRPLVQDHKRLEPVQFLPAAGVSLGEWVGTNFERKYLKEDRPIYTLAARKT